MATSYHYKVQQGSQEWHDLRCGNLTASEMKLILTPTLKIADNDKTRAHLYELAAQRISRYVEPTYINNDMLRGMTDEISAKAIYATEYAPIDDCGIVISDDLGFPICYSPDGLVGEDGLIEVKSRRQKYQVQSIIEHAMPEEYALQVQTGLLVTGRKWLDFISYSAGLPMMTVRVYPDEKMQAAIVEAATKFEEKLQAMLAKYHANLAEPNARFYATERTVEQEMYV